MSAGRGGGHARREGKGRGVRARGGGSEGDVREGRVMLRRVLLQELKEWRRQREE